MSGGHSTEKKKDVVPTSSNMLVNPFVKLTIVMFSLGVSSEIVFRLGIKIMAQHTPRHNNTRKRSLGFILSVSSF